MANPVSSEPTGIGDSMSSAPQDLGELPPAVIPAPQREIPDIHADAPMHGTDADNRSVGAGEGSGNCGDMLGSGWIELAGDA
jgi:hypothetical protein